LRAYDEDMSRFGSTPISQLAQYPRPSQGGIQTCFLFKPGRWNDLNNPTERPKLEKKFRYFAQEMDYLWFDQGSLVEEMGDGVFDFSMFSSKIQELKALNGRMHIGVHGGGIASIAPLYLMSPFFLDEDYLHAPDGTMIIGSSQSLTTAHRFLNVTDPYARLRGVTGWQNFLRDNPDVSGFFLDGYVPWGMFQPELSSGCLESPPDCRTEFFWIPSYQQFAMEIKDGIPSNRDFMFNGFSSSSPDPYDVRRAGFAGYHNGAMMEWGHEMYFREPAVFRTYMQAIDRLTRDNKKVVFYVEVQIIEGWEPVPAYSNDLDLQRFFLASYLLFQNNLTYFGYYPGGKFEPGQLFFYSDWNKSYGTPLDVFRNNENPDLYYRAYSSGYAVVNASTQPVRFEFPPGVTAWREWDADNGPVVSGSVMIPPKTGKYYFNEDLFDRAPPARPGNLRRR